MGGAAYISPQLARCGRPAVRSTRRHSMVAPHVVDGTSAVSLPLLQCVLLQWLFPRLRVPLLCSRRRFFLCLLSSRCSFLSLCLLLMCGDMIFGSENGLSEILRIRLSILFLLCSVRLMYLCLNLLSIYVGLSCKAVLHGLLKVLIFPSTWMKGYFAKATKPCQHRTFLLKQEAMPFPD